MTSRATLLITAVIAALLTGCYGSGERQKCTRQRDCPAGSFCSGNGFCRSECTADRDCPCGAVCAATCGLCLKVDDSTPATCFAHNRGMSDDDVKGACGPVASADGAVERAGCSPRIPLMCPTYTPTPSEDAVLDGGADGRAATPDADRASTQDAATDR